MIKLDYTITSPEERSNLVQKILADNPNPSEKYLEILADYLILCMEKEEKKEKKILTANRLATVSKRETSFEGLAAKLESGEDGIYTLMTNDKNIIFQPKTSITSKDLSEIPALRQLKDTINTWEEKLKNTEGKDAFTIKKAIIEMRKDQYTIKSAYRKPIHLNHVFPQPKSTPEFAEGLSFNTDGSITPLGISLLNPKVIAALLKNYSLLKQASAGQFTEDTWYFISDFEAAKTKALEPYPSYRKIVECKCAGLQNKEIQKALLDSLNIYHSVEYISSLWCRKIPKIIASAAEDIYLDWYFSNIEKGQYKKCSRCGQIKLMHNKYFSKNKTSKDGYYSICKTCRNGANK